MNATPPSNINQVDPNATIVIYIWDRCKYSLQMMDELNEHLKDDILDRIEVVNIEHVINKNGAYPPTLVCVPCMFINTPRTTVSQLQPMTFNGKLKIQRFCNMTTSESDTLSVEQATGKSNIANVFEDSHIQQESVEPGDVMAKIGNMRQFEFDQSTARPSGKHNLLFETNIDDVGYDTDPRMKGPVTIDLDELKRERDQQMQRLTGGRGTSA